MYRLMNYLSVREDHVNASAKFTSLTEFNAIFSIRSMEIHKKTKRRRSRHWR